MLLHIPWKSESNSSLAHSYGYQNSYSTTTYGAQGGADGGGFVQAGYGGSQGGSQDSPGGSKA